jgi:hypothetical protein
LVVEEDIHAEAIGQHESVQHGRGQTAFDDRTKVLKGSATSSHSIDTSGWKHNWSDFTSLQSLGIEHGRILARMVSRVA